MIEDLHVAGMLRNRRLARQIAGANWAEIRRQLTYKTEQTGASLIVADRWFACSKTCSGCGAAKAKLTLSERDYVAWPAASSSTGTTTPPVTWPLGGRPAQLVRELPEGTGVRRPRADRSRTASGRACGTQRHRREAVAR